MSPPSPPSSEGPSVSQRLAAGLVVVEDVGEDLLGVLAHGGRPGRDRELIPFELDREGHLVGPQARRGDPREAVSELGVGGDGLRRVDRGDRGVDLVAERQPLGGRSGAEDVSQLSLELAVVAGVIGVLLARPAFEQLGAADALTEVLPERPLGRHEQDVSVRGLVHLVADAGFKDGQRIRRQPLFEGVSAEGAQCHSHERQECAQGEPGLL